MKKAIFAFVLLSFMIVSNAQLVPEVGKRMPDFTLDNIVHYKTSVASLRDFKGKWLVLDFWFVGCVSCIKSFPKINALQEKFNDSIQFLMVGHNGVKANGKGIESLFQKLSKKQNLDIASAYDSVLIPLWNIKSMPHIVIVDPKGIVRFITNGQDMTAEKFEGLIKGENVSFYEKDTKRPYFDGTIDRLDTTAINKLIYRSVLTKWNGEEQHIDDVNVFVRFPTDQLEKAWSIAKVPLVTLYNQAYAGSWVLGLYDSLYPKPLLEIEDSTLFRYDYKNSTGLYNYSLTVPPSKISRNYIMLVLQRELKNIFGYNVSFEKRQMQVWKLVAIPGANQRLLTKGGESYITEGSIAAGFTVRNLPLHQFFNRMFMYMKDNELPFFDETGFVGNIDISIDADMTNIQDVKKALKKNGLDLVIGSKEMEVIVISDPKK